MIKSASFFWLSLVVTLTVIPPPVHGQNQATDDPASKPQASPATDETQSLKRLSEDYDIWIDPKRKAVVIGGEVCLREGQLEMFACLKGTKEHESVVALDSKAYMIHAALLAVGAKVGHPVQFDPEYMPAAGTEVDVFVLWKDQDGKKRTTRAQEWVRHVKTGKPMPYVWVFSGSGFWTDPETGEKHYHAEGGDVICVTNFLSAMLDLPIPSTQANADLLFDAFTEKIPPRGTKVRVVLIPRPEKKNGNEPASQSSP